MATLSAGVEKLYEKSKNEKEESVERYRAEYSSFDKLEDLLKYQINIIDYCSLYNILIIILLSNP